MRIHALTLGLALLAFPARVNAAQPAAAPPTVPPRPAVAAAAAPAPAPPLDATAEPRPLPDRGRLSRTPLRARVIKYSNLDVHVIHCRVRNTTAIVLPAGERVLDYTVGDKDFWQLEGVQNLAYVKPAEPKTTTNVNLICESGNVYSFVLRETGGGEPDYKVFVEPVDPQLVHAVDGSPRLARQEELELWKGQAQALQAKLEDTKKEARREVEQARAEAEAQAAQAAADARAEAERAAAAYRSEYPVKLAFDYVWEYGRAFDIRTVFHDERFTYLKCRAAEKPALYEVKDGKPNLVDFRCTGDTYILPRVVDEGYLQAGKNKAYFRRAR